MPSASRTSTPAAKRRAAGRRGSHAPTPRRQPPKGRTTAKRPPAKRRPARGAQARRRPSLKTSLIVVALAAACLVAGYFAWLRNSSFVAVTKVEVSGLSSPDAPRIEEALTKAATQMTTLNVDPKRLERAVAPFPTVVSVSADPDLPHGLAIDVKERPPVLLAAAKGESVAVAGDGTLLRGLELGEAADQLPALEVDALPESGKLEGDSLQQALVLGAAPAPLRPLVEGVSIEDGRGVEVTMRGGIPIRFGTSEAAAAKWAAAAAVLADPKLETLTYVDVRVPERPAVGGAAAPPEPDPIATAPVEPVVAEEPVEPTL